MVIRHKYLDKLLRWVDTPVIKVITGVRRSGKSFLMKMLQEELIRHGVDESTIININYELISFHNIRSYKKLDAYIHENTNGKVAKTYVFIDEIQNCDGWEYALASLLAEERYDLYVTGSNASMLSGDLATHIAGRYVEIDVYPLTFSEYTNFVKELERSEKGMSEHFNDYLKFGGFPGLSNTVDRDESKTQYLKGIRDTVILRDVIQRHKIRDSVVLEKVLLYLFDNVGQIFSSKKVADYLGNIGYKASVDSITTYIKILEDAKIIYSAPRYDIKGKKIMQRLDKHYLVDLGLRYADLGDRTNDIAQILENVVFMELISRGYKVYVGKEGDREVDFIAEKGDERIYYQVCYLLATVEVKDREYRSLLAIKDAYPKVVLSMDTIHMGTNNGIKHMNILDFLFEQ
ncbi:MAG: hypothetical protein B6I17_02040 [Tenericutes bacterium 4572_104]|nr:MAG: hypothetical protein B6I17_02040 [Tenericutes bacterium 4572_104]